LSIDHEDDPPMRASRVPSLKTMPAPAEEKRDTDPAPPMTESQAAEILAAIGGMEKRLAEQIRKTAARAADNLVEARKAISEEMDAKMQLLANMRTEDMSEVRDHLLEFNDKLDDVAEDVHKLVVTADFTGEQTSTLFEMHAAHAALPADVAHGRYPGNSGNGHDPEIELNAES
jgi:adenylosuccinate synthase